MHLKTGLSKEQQTIVFASWFGWALDGYDLVLMLFVISSVNQLFFSDSSAISLLATFATYIIALVMRPIGGALFGNFGDKYGSKKNHDGNNSWILNCDICYRFTSNLANCRDSGTDSTFFLRFVQGLFAGGEWASGSVITMEMVPKKTQGLLSGFVQSGYLFGFVLASIMYLLMLNIFPNDEFVEIGGEFYFLQD